MQNRNKKKILIVIALLLLMTVFSAVGFSLAVLTQHTENRANNFTFGNVDIDLKEPEWDKLDPEDKIVYPGRTIVKDPYIENTGGHDLYAYIEVSVPKKTVRTVEIADGKEVIGKAKLQELFSFTPNDGWTCIDKDETSADYVTYLYAYTEKVLAPGESTNTLFDSVTYLNMLEGEIPMGTVLEMPVKAYAIQSGYLNEQGENMEAKMTDAFTKYQSEQAN